MMSDRTLWDLKVLAECARPDSETSAGGQLLRAVEATVAEWLRDGIAGDVEDAANEIGTNAPSPYYGELWAEFVDVEAYLEDVPEGCFLTMFDMAQSVLRDICRRLALALLTETVAGNE